MPFFACVGVFRTRNSVVDVFFVLGSGVAGLMLGQQHFWPAAFILGFILYPIIEDYLRRALVFRRGD